MWFSWTTFFFGFIVPLVRGDLKWALIMVAISIAIGIPTLGLVDLFLALFFHLYIIKFI